jgi:hypothetical protein
MTQVFCGLPALPEITCTVKRNCLSTPLIGTNTGQAIRHTYWTQALRGSPVHAQQHRPPSSHLFTSPPPAPLPSTHHVTVDVSLRAGALRLTRRWLLVGFASTTTITSQARCRLPSRAAAARRGRSASDGRLPLALSHAFAPRTLPRMCLANRLCRTTLSRRRARGEVDGLLAVEVERLVAAAAAAARRAVAPLLARHAAVCNASWTLCVMSGLAVLGCHGTPVGSRRSAVWSFIVALLHLRVSAARVLLVPAALVVVVIVCSCALRCSYWRAGRLSAEATSMCNATASGGALRARGSAGVGRNLCKLRAFGTGAGVESQVLCPRVSSADTTHNVRHMDHGLSIGK